MESVPLRHALNPAFQPTTNYYISLPVLGNLSFDFGTNAISLQDVVYNRNGQTISFLHPNGNVDAFYNKLKSTSVLNNDLNVNLLSFGFRHDYSYWTFSLNQRMSGAMLFPKDVFKLSLYGTPDIYHNNYDLKLLKASATYYTEAALGYSRRIDEQWTVGAKLKFLYGIANISSSNEYATLNAGLEKWQVLAKGTLNYASGIQTMDDLNTMSLQSLFKHSGSGAGVDLGAQLRLTNDLYLSASITDLGFIKWTQNVGNVNYAVDYTYDGVVSANSNTDIDALNSIFRNAGDATYVSDSILNVLEKSSSSKRTTNSYFTNTTAKVNIGAEYKLLSNKLSLGLLWRQLYYGGYISHELTSSVNVKPTCWLNAALSYSLLNGSNTFGAGLGIKTGFVHWFAALDYIPFKKATYMNMPIPYSVNSINLSLGMNIVFDKLFFGKNKTLKEGRTMNPRTGLYHPKFKTEDDGCHCY